MTDLKKTIAGVAIAGVLAGAGGVAVDGQQLDNQIRALPVSERLKVSDKEKIIEHVEMADVKNSYTFDADGRPTVASSTSTPVVYYAYETDKVLPIEANEQAELRNTKTRTYHVAWNEDGSEQLVAQSGFLQYHDEETGDWKEIGIATTTPEAYELQTRPGVLERAVELLVSVAKADDTGTTAAGTGSSIDQAIIYPPGDAWTNPGNLTTSNNVYASSPDNSSGVYACGGGSSTNINYSNLFQSGATIGTSQAWSSNCFTTSDATYTAGGASNVWGATLTQSVINDSTFGVGVVICASKGCDYGISKWLVGSNFGFAISASAINGVVAGMEGYATNSGAGAFVDQMTARVYYTAGGGGGGGAAPDNTVFEMIDN